MQYFDTETQIVIATLIAFTSFAIIVCIVCSFKENVINTEQPKDEEESKRLFKSGEGLYNSGKWDEAADFLERSIKLGYDTSIANRLLGHCFIKMAETHSACLNLMNAEHFLLRAVVLDKDEYINYIMLALLYRTKKQYTEELEYLKTSVDLLEHIEIPKLKSKTNESRIGELNKAGLNLSVYYLAMYTADIGVCLLNISTHNNSLAKEYFEKSNNIIENAHATKCLAALCFEEREYDQAITYARKALEFESDNNEIKGLLKKAIEYKYNPPVKTADFFKKIHFPRIKSNFFYLFAIASIFLVVGAIVYKRDLFDGYYMLLRVITCAVCTYSAAKFKTEWTRWIFGVFAVLYNPVLPVHLGNEDLWSIINLTTVVYMWIALRAESKAAKSTSA